MVGKLTGWLDHLKDKPALWEPRVKHRYQHEVTVISQKDTAVGYVLTFPSEPKAKAAIEALEAANNAPIVLYDKKILPGKEGFFE